MPQIPLPNPSVRGGRCRGEAPFDGVGIPSAARGALLWLFAATLALHCGGGGARAAERPDSAANSAGNSQGVLEVVSATTARPVEAMIASLGDESYVVRRMAAAELLLLGEAVRERLIDAAADGDLEIRRRSRQVLDALDVARARRYRAELESRLTEFVEDDKAEHGDYDFAGWKAYRAIAGADRPARELFAAMQRSEPELLSMVDGEVEPLSRALSARMLRITQSTSHPLPQYHTPITAGRAAAFFFIAANKDIALNARSGSQMYSFANQIDVRTALAKGNEAPPLKKLIGNWIATKQDGDRNLGYYKVLLATRHGLKEGRQAGLNIISDDAAGAPPHQYLQALMAIGRFGTQEDIATIEPLLKNNTVCQTMTRSINGVRTTYTVEVRDAALAVLVRLSSQNPRDYGLDRLQEHPQMLFNMSTLGFTKEDEKRRDKAIAKWRNWRESEKRREVKRK